MANINQFNKNLLQIYSKDTFTIETILYYNLAKINLDVRDDNENTLLHHIVQKNDRPTLVALLNYIKINNQKNILHSQNANGDTALHIVVRNGNEELAKLLDIAGINKSIKNANGEFVSSDEQNTKVESEINLSDLDDSEYNKMNKPMSIFNKKKCINTISEQKQRQRQRQEQKRSPSSDTEKFLKELTEKLGEIKINKKLPMNLNLMNGGNDSSIFEINFIDINNNEVEQLGGAKRKKSKRSTDSTSSKGTKESSNIHDDVVKKFLDLGYPEDDARAMKAGLYSLVKEKHSELSNLEKAKKMLEYLEDKTVLNTLKKKLDELRDIIKKAREIKKNQTVNANVDKPVKTTKSKSTKTKETK